MLLRWMKEKIKYNEKTESIDDVVNSLKSSDDFVQFHHQINQHEYRISYFSTLIDPDRVIRDFLPYLNKAESNDLAIVINSIPINKKEMVTKGYHAKEALMRGQLLLESLTSPKQYALFEVSIASDREISQPEVEFSVTGPQESFIEALDTNLSLIRKRLPIGELKTKKLVLGKLTKTKIAILYVEGIVDVENLRTMQQRLEAIDFDQIIDSGSIAQMISDDSLSVFPQFVNTERPERVAAVLAEGKVAFIADGSPEVVFGPTTLVEFFSSLEDYYLGWQVASFTRLLRFFAVTFSTLASPIYVAVLTYHYELIPKDLLGPIIGSRIMIPFPPIIEAVFLELTIELLREAGARLPTKVGQTIGIVGGIVIGQASVEAGLTSNILLIIVALAALASFTTPIYQIGNTIRIIRFPFLLMSAWFGLIGIGAALLFTIVHLLHLQSLGRPYLSPIYPPRFADWKDAFIRLPFSWMSSRPVYLRAQKKKRFNFFEANKKHDIDE
ncbi:spore germination protein GerA [Alkalihalobacillus alcalophilus ATCC 27647 = CGMCC 1.3604]|uniref:Spore germination protein GerA n=1 Tax=Alkalihalobacillus alcalophilus ATCC 27647 = CGMCC 1.3604 TaxID=1218173 RepID=A0A4S4JZU1_ALKAL|nr:spore germination protein [Alkalihalobacillus alcalophilus]MED1560385.1 spore germination protein [Alkalihalobacillus alcalophilus]THG90801.1 spore germination protein GerA [Alkalihalobacillus alcalophilus ATCC 27647 = CGMCC 1.3604]